MVTDSGIDWDAVEITLNLCSDGKHLINGILQRLRMRIMICRVTSPHDHIWSYLSSDVLEHVFKCSLRKVAVIITPFASCIRWVVRYSINIAATDALKCNVTFVVGALKILRVNMKITK